MFENVEIDTEALPRAAEVDWLPMAPDFLRRRVIATLLVLGLVTLGLATLHTILSVALGSEGLDPPLFLIWVLFLPVAAILVSWPFFSVPRMAYAVRDKDILFRSGVLWRRVTAIPYNRIQHVEKDTAPLDRRYGLANLKIYTAGGAGGDLNIHGLGEDSAERIRAFVLERAGAAIER